MGTGVMIRHLVCIAILATAAAAHAGPPASPPSAQHAQALAGVRARLAQLRAELGVNKAALAGGGLPAEDQARLNARAREIAVQIDALLAQERELTRK